MPLALALIFLLLCMSFGSLSVAVLIRVNVPLAVIGGIGALWVRGLPFSISARAGFIALSGIAVAHIDLQRRPGMAPCEAALRRVVDRLRPVLTIVLGASLGFVAMALANFARAEVQRLLATVVIVGLLSAKGLAFLVLAHNLPLV